MVCGVRWLTCCWKSGEPRGAKEGGGGKGEGWGGRGEGWKSCSTRDTNRSCCCPLNLQHHKDKDRHKQGEWRVSHRRRGGAVFHCGSKVMG